MTALVKRQRFRNNVGWWLGDRPRCLIIDHDGTFGKLTPGVWTRLCHLRSPGVHDRGVSQAYIRISTSRWSAGPVHQGLVISELHSCMMACLHPSANVSSGSCDLEGVELDKTTIAIRATMPRFTTSKHINTYDFIVILTHTSASESVMLSMRFPWFFTGDTNTTGGLDC